MTSLGPLSRRTAIQVAFAAVALLVAGCDRGAEGLLREASPPDPGPVHVHGLGVNPADDLLYVATHTGLFRIPEPGRVEHVGETYRDFMGFTVIGPDRFLTSGHPDARDRDLPVLLGLMESTDAGETWESVSLLGEADFHVLRHQHGRIYGYDSTSERIMVSSDGVEWRTISSIGLLDLAVDPSSPRALLATTREGLRASEDGGRTWTAVPRRSAPPLVLLAWTSQGIWGAAADGSIFLGGDDGRSWERRGALGGFPEALLAHDGELFAAAHGVGILRSGDGGRSWDALFTSGGEEGGTEAE